MPDLYDYQKLGVNHLVSKQRALLLDGMGLGKTAQSVVAFNTLGAKNVLILCPSATRYGWAEEVERWSKHDYQIFVLTKTVEFIPVTNKPMVVICSYSLVASPAIADQLKGRRWGVTVADEIHFCKSSKAKRTKVVLGRGGIVTKSVYFWGLSGTLMPNTPVDLWQVFRSMGKEHLPEQARDYGGFTRIFCNRYKTKWGWDVSGAKNLDVLKKCLFDYGFALRRTKEQVLDQMPDKTYRTVPMEGKAIMWDEEFLAKAIRLGMNAGELAEARKELADEKLPALLEYMKEIDGPCVVFCWHRHVIEEIVAQTDSVAYYGGMSVTQKEKAIEAFVSGKKQFFVANIVSAGTGLNGLQKRSSHCLFAELPWTYSEIEQASDRLHRIGQRDNVLVDIPVLKGGVEEYILKTVLKKENIFRNAIDPSSKRISS